MNRFLFLIAALLSLSIQPALADQPSSGGDAPLVIAGQGSFFVGGHDLHSSHLAQDPENSISGVEGTVAVDQVYVHYQRPVDAGTRPAFVLIHGCCLTGKTWETTPDGRMGWDEYLLRRGYPVYVLDQAGRGRSALDISAVNAVKNGEAAPETLTGARWPGREATWTAFRFGPRYGEVYSGLQYPIEALPEFWKQMVPDWTVRDGNPSPTVAALPELTAKVGGSVLVSHSQSGIFPFEAMAAGAKNVVAIVAIEGTCPSQTENMSVYGKTRILLVWGDHVPEHPRWGPRLADCRKWMATARRAGVDASLLLLPDVGIMGNDHMLMQDRNNLQIADRILAWLEEK